MDYQYLHDLSYTCLVDLSTDEGINASSLHEAYGCIFGRDSAITVLKILNVYRKTQDRTLLQICRRALLTLAKLQGSTENLESGEEPGKIIHEFRRDNYERLIRREKPWFVYEDKTLRNYDSVDATALTLIAWYRFWHITHDELFLQNILPHAERALEWMMVLGDKDNDYFLEYELSPLRKHGGLEVQSWTDSSASLRQANGSFPDYPIAPIEVQAYSWLACKLWSDFYKATNPETAALLTRYASQLKLQFNTQFIVKNDTSVFGAQALDGKKHPITTPTANPLLCLWASYNELDSPESIIADEYIPSFVKRAFQEDLFDPNAGIRTMSSLSQTFNPSPTSYHNGSFWPMLNGLIHEGLMIWDYQDKAELLKHASLKPILHFKSPIELYVTHPQGYEEFTSIYGKHGCRYQAWTAAAILDFVN